MAVDVGLEGLFRRLGVAKPFIRLLGLFHKSLPSKLILWNEVEAVDFSSTQIKLSKAYSKLDGIHPSDLADILEELDHASRVALFNSLDEERAADVLEELQPEVQVKLLENLDEEKAADVLEKMPADEVADILDELRSEKAERLLAEMETAPSSEVRSLMGYPDNSVGSLMSKDYVFFNQSMKVVDALAELRAVKPEAEVVYSVYVLDARGKYVATVSLRDIVVADPEARLGEIMNAVTDPLHDSDDAGSCLSSCSSTSCIPRRSWTPTARWRAPSSSRTCSSTLCGSISVEPGEAFGSALANTVGDSSCSRPGRKPFSRDYSSSSRSSGRG